MHPTAALLTLGLVLAASGIRPAVAQTLPEGVDQLLWCAAAFRIVAEDFATVGEAEQAELYDERSDALLAEGVVRLAAAGYSEQEVMQVRGATSTAVDSQLGGEIEPDFTVEDCEAALL